MEVSEKVLIDRELLAKATMLPSARSMKANRRDIEERRRAQAEIRKMLAAAPAAPVVQAEPVAWVAADTLNSPHPGCVSSLAYVSQIDKDRGREYVPLYAAPPAQPDAAFDPDTIRALLEERDALLAERDRLKEALTAMLEIHGVTQRYADAHIEIPQSWVDVSDLARAALAQETKA